MSESAARPESVLEVMARMQAAGVLDSMVLAGSWCLYFYARGRLLPEGTGTLRTDDLDFLLPRPYDAPKSVNLPEILKEMGFLVRRGLNGSIQLEHADLRIEFLIPERGRGGETPELIKALGVTAQPLRFLDLILTDPIRVRIDDLALRVPAPERFGLHKLIISERRNKPAKAANDREQGVRVVVALEETGRGSSVTSLFTSLPSKWRAAILRATRRAGADDLAARLEGGLRRG